MAFIEASLEELPVSVDLGQSCLATKISAPGPSNFGWFRHTDEPLGALVQGLEVVGELGVGILAEIKNWSDADQEGSISREEKHLTRDGDGAVEESQRNPHRHTCC